MIKQCSQTNNIPHHAFVIITAMTQATLALFDARPFRSQKLTRKESMMIYIKFRVLGYQGV